MMLRNIFKLTGKIERGLESSRRIPVLDILIRAGLEGHKNLPKDRSASIAYFTFLSLFPLFLGIIAISGIFLKDADAQVRVNEFLVEVFPVSADFVTRNFDDIIKRRGTAGLISILLLMWSASKMVAALSRGINSSLKLKRTHKFYLSPIRNFALTLSVTLLILLTIAVTPLVDLLDQLELTFIGSRWNSIISLFAGHLTGFAISSLLLGSIYLLTPYVMPKTKDLIIGTLISAFLLEVGKDLFTYYVSNLSRYNMIYGSISSIIILLIWLYYSTRVVLYGADIIYACRLRRESADKSQALKS